VGHAPLNSVCHFTAPLPLDCSRRRRAVWFKHRLGCLTCGGCLPKGATRLSLAESPAPVFLLRAGGGGRSLPFVMASSASDVTAYGVAAEAIRKAGTGPALDDEASMGEDAEMIFLTFAEPTPSEAASEAARIAERSAELWHAMHPGLDAKHCPDLMQGWPVGCYGCFHTAGLLPLESFSATSRKSILNERIFGCGGREHKGSLARQDIHHLKPRLCLTCTGFLDQYGKWKVARRCVECNTVMTAGENSSITQKKRKAVVCACGAKWRTHASPWRIEVCSTPRAAAAAAVRCRPRPCNFRGHPIQTLPGKKSMEGLMRQGRTFPGCCLAGAASLGGPRASRAGAHVP